MTIYSCLVTFPNGEHITAPLPHTYIDVKDLPTEFTWANKDSVNYLTASRNQHIPQCNHLHTL